MVENNGYDDWPYDVTLSSFVAEAFRSSDKSSPLFRVSTLDAVDQLLTQKKAFMADNCVVMLPWVNLYPPKSHTTILSDFPQWWQRLREDLPIGIPRTPQKPDTISNSSIDIGVWMAAVVLRMIPPRQMDNQLDIFSCIMQDTLSRWSGWLGLRNGEDACDIGDLFVSAKLFLRGSHSLLFTSLSGKNERSADNLPDLEPSDASWEFTPRNQ